MGRGIAAAFLLARVPVVVVETDGFRQARCVAAIEYKCVRAAAAGQLTEREAVDRLRLLRVVVSPDLSVLAPMDVVIEAAFETIALKQTLFRQLDAACSNECVLATATMTLTVDEVAGGSQRPERVVGMHFFAPAETSRLVEVVRGKQTSPATLATASALAAKLRKSTVDVGGCKGLVSHRLAAAGAFTCFKLLEEGCQPEAVDRALRRFGFAKGVFEQQDCDGLDVTLRKLTVIAPKSESQDRLQLLRRMIAEGRLGVKSLSGWYHYDVYNGGPNAKPTPDLTVNRLVNLFPSRYGHRFIRDDEITNRILHATVNEAALMVERGLVARPSDADVICVEGLGFPAHLGGPCFLADRIGVAKVVEDMWRYTSALGPHAATPPCRLLLDIAFKESSLNEMN